MDDLFYYTKKTIYREEKCKDPYNGREFKYQREERVDDVDQIIDKLTAIF